MSACRCGLIGAGIGTSLTGRTPDTARMLRHLDRLLAERGKPHAA